MERYPARLADGSINSEAIAAAVSALVTGHLVILPTDTVYGIAADSTNADAVSALFSAKGRPDDRAIPLLAASAEQAAQVAELSSPVIAELIDRWWPGPLTIVAHSRHPLPPGIAQNGTVGVRVPGDAIARIVAGALGRPLATTSANISGAPPATTCDEAVTSVGDHVAVALDGGPAQLRQASTVVDCTRSPIVVLRQGGAHIDFSDPAQL
ncbi:MAG: L-threonylcarbamoyladenylate synthase [Chloroflexi bacterium]|nr:L-threonylcarbamoyladenylate synthase [Chloroflexota bacterium]